MAGEKKPGPGDLRTIYMLGKTGAAITAIASAGGAIVLASVAVLFGLAGYTHAIPLRIEEHIAGAGMVISAAAALQCVWILVGGLREYRAVPYVAPVREQVDALPAHEVLVRGASDPGEGLLRATAQETAEQTENRMSQGGRHATSN